jgi:hypothetical protein
MDLKRDGQDRRQEDGDGSWGIHVSMLEEVG